VPADRLFIETDSPDILPAGAEGLTEPSHVTEVAAAVAGLRGRDVKEIAAMTMENGLRVFGHAAYKAFLVGMEKFIRVEQLLGKKATRLLSCSSVVPYSAWAQ
jgi:hypothetical protein